MEDSNIMSVILTNNIGITGAKIHWMRTPDNTQFWCRQAIAFFGSYNMTTKEIRTISPFDPRFNDNYIEGKGKTKEEALKNMESESSGASDFLWI